MPALPADAPTFEVDETAGTVTITGTFAWIAVDNIGPFAPQTDYEITLPLSGSVFDPDFTAPGVADESFQQLPGTAGFFVIDPKFGDTDGSGSLLHAVYNSQTYANDYGVSQHGLLSQNFSETFPAGGLDGDETYAFIVSMNEDLTEIEGVSVLLTVRTPIFGTDIFTTEYFLGEDTISAPVPVRYVLNNAGIATSGDDVFDFATDTAVTISGLGGDDLIDGGSADDVLKGNGGKDTIRGLAGEDRLVGGGGQDDLSGGGDDDLLNGGGGGDSLAGNGGNDKLQGRNGDDDLDGGSGDDRMIGGNGDDRMTAGAGNDRQTGNDGADTFAFGTGFGLDTITDFATGTDTLELDDALWGGGLTRAQVVSTYASVVGGEVVFDFGGGQTITLQGVSATAGLDADLMLV